MTDAISIREGQIILHGDEQWRILHVEDFQRVLANRLADGRNDFLPITELRPLHQVRDSDRRRIRNRPSATIIRKRSEERAYAEAVEEFNFALRVLAVPRDQRRTLITEMRRRFGYNEATAYRRIRIVAVHNSPNALYRAVRSDVGKRRLPPKVIEIIRSQLQAHRFIATPKTLPKILDFVNGHCRKDGLKEISLATLRSFEKEMPLKEKLEKQGRKKQAKEQFQFYTKHLPNNDYPLAIIQVDHTPLQVCLVDEQDRQPINDPWLTLVIDTYSRMVLGFYLTFDAPSTLSTGMALSHAFLPKEDYLKAMGVAGEWPCWGFPDIVIVDNAAELNGRMMHGARGRYRFILRDRPVGAANFGGHVESAFKTFMYEFKSIPGTKFSNPVERGEYDSEGNAIFTIAEFEAFFTEFLVNDYHVGKHSGKGMEKDVPLSKWKRGIFEGDVMPPTGLPSRPIDELTLRISLMPMDHRVLSNGQIEINAHTYSSPELSGLNDSVDLTKPTAQRLFEIRYDPRNIQVVWLYDEASERYIELRNTDPLVRPVSLWEDRAIRRRIGDPSAPYIDQRFDSKVRREDMKESAAKRTKQRRLEQEKALRRSSSALVQPPPPPQPKTSTKKALDPAKRAEMLKRLRPPET